MRTLIATVCLAACATTAPPPPNGGPRGLHASEHLDVARQHEDLAQQTARWPDDPGPGPGGGGMRWIRSWDTSVEQERFAKLHRAKAAELQAEYAEACGERSLAELSTSPLQRHAVGGWNTSTGVILYLAPSAGDPDRLLADMKCHRAWMRLAPAGMEDCPLDLPGIALDARGDRDGVTVSIVVRDPKLVGELQRRAAHELEAHVHHAP